MKRVPMIPLHSDELRSNDVPENVEFETPELVLVSS